VLPPCQRRNGSPGEHVHERLAIPARRDREAEGVEDRRRRVMGDDRPLDHDIPPDTPPQHDPGDREDFGNQRRVVTPDAAVVGRHYDEGAVLHTGVTEDLAQRGDAGDSAPQRLYVAEGHPSLGMADGVGLGNVHERHMGLGGPKIGAGGFDEVRRQSRRPPSDQFHPVHVPRVRDHRNVDLLREERCPQASLFGHGEDRRHRRVRSGRSPFVVAHAVLLRPDAGDHRHVRGGGHRRHSGLGGQAIARFLQNRREGQQCQGRQDPHTESHGVTSARAETAAASTDTAEPPGRRRRTPDRGGRSTRPRNTP